VIVRIDGQALALIPPGHVASGLEGHGVRSRYGRIFERKWRRLFGSQELYTCRPTHRRGRIDRIRAILSTPVRPHSSAPTQSSSGIPAVEWGSHR